MTFLHLRNDSLAAGCWSGPNARVNARVVGLRRHLRVLPSRTRPSLFAGDWPFRSRNQSASCFGAQAFGVLPKLRSRDCIQAVFISHS